MTRYLKIQDLARAASVNPFTIRRAIARGDLDAVRVGRCLRVSEEAFERFIKPTPHRRGAQR
jgi:excisionase family DNA binding protein